MIVCDTSVLIAAFGRWHESHTAAAAAVRRSDALVEHVAIETFSVLTRLPPPRRVAPDLVLAFFDAHYPARATRLPTPPSAQVLRTAADAGVTGGALYDLTVGLSAAAQDAVVLSLDRRAVRTYEAAAVRYELLS